jgi:predicted CopG family antitoxin
VSNQSNIVGPSETWEPTNKSISIRTTTWKRLQKYIHYGNTFDSVIRDLLDEKERIIDSDMQEDQKGNMGEFKL